MNINDRELLARTLQAEAGNQGYGGMLAAGSVIMNRANASGYGNGLRGVILKPGQFSAWNSTTGYAGGEQGQDMANMRASDEAYKAADDLISGGYEDVTGGATHYYNPAISQPKWGQKAGGDWKQIGDHVFGFADAAKKPNPNQAIASDTMRVLGKQPKGLLASAQATDDTESKMIPEEKPKGLLGSLGIQKMVEGAEGEAGQRFFQRDTFKDTAIQLAPLLASMGSNPALQKATAGIAAQRTEEKARNKSLEFLAGLPGGEEYVRIAKAAGPKAAMQAYLESRKASAGGKDTALIRNALAAGFKPGTKEYQRFIASGGDIYSQETAMMLGLPKPEAGMNYEFEKGEAGNITGYKLVPIEGGSAELEAQQLADKQAKGQSGQEQKDVSFYAAGERVLGELKKEGAFLPATGIAASVVRNTPGIKLFAQRQENVAQDLAIMESQMQFETLADLKAASPTGASGLGQLTDAERRALGKLKYNFDTSQDETAIRRTIRSAMLMKSYFENGILDPVTNGYRNATPEEMDQMSNGINPFSAEGGPMLKDVERYLGGPQTIDADDGQYVIKKVTE